VTSSRLKIAIDVFLTPAEFERVYRAVFPAGEFTPFYPTMAMDWKPALA